VASLRDLDGPVDAVVVAVPAGAVPDVVDEAGIVGCGGMVVYAAGFAETPAGAPLQERLREVPLRHGLPVCGPNGNGIVSLHRRVAMWGDSVQPQPAGPVAIVTQSGNVGVNALASRRGLGLHTVVSCGNQALLDATDYLRHLSAEDGVRAVALYLELDGDGTRLCEALASCAERAVRVVVLKAGAGSVSASAAQAHTGAVAGDHRVFRALIAEAGGVVVDDLQELLEVAKALAIGRRAPRSGLAVLTCSGGDSAIAADAAERVGVPMPALAPKTVARLREVLPDAATAANPLDYTSLLRGDREALRAMVGALASDPAIRIRAGGLRPDARARRRRARRRRRHPLGLHLERGGDLRSAARRRDAPRAARRTDRA
jgi:acetate---CoA ligase (ADP-forming)